MITASSTAASSVTADTCQPIITWVKGGVITVSTLILARVHAPGTTRMSAI